jgi:hypothetical protein
MNVFQKKLNTLTKLFKTGYEEMWHEELSYYWSRKQVKVMRKQAGELSIKGLKESITTYKRKDNE